MQILLSSVKENNYVLDYHSNPLISKVIQSSHRGFPEYSLLQQTTAGDPACYGRVVGMAVAGTPANRERSDLAGPRPLQVKNLTCKIQKATPPSQSMGAIFSPWKKKSLGLMWYETTLKVPAQKLNLFSEIIVLVTTARSSSARLEFHKNTRS